MTKNLTKSLLALSVCVTTATALAQAPDQPRQTRVEERTVVRGQMPEMWLFKASDLVGKEVRNNKGEKLGKIYELAVNTNDGQIAYAVLQFGGFLGVGDKLFAIPWEALQLKPRDKSHDNELIFIFDIDKDRLKDAPGFDQNAWPDMADATWTGTVRTYWEKEITINRKGQVTERIVVTEQPVKFVRRASKELTGRDIKNAAFQDIGDVNDLMVDVISGYVVYVVAKLDDKANATDENNKKINGELAALPWKALLLKPDAAKGTQDTFVLNIPETKLQGVPAFANRNWPNMNDMAWNHKVFNFYGVPGFWQA